jgi:hypothetical protein
MDDSMPALTDNEARAIIYFAIGVSSEGGDQAYQLAFAGEISHDAQGKAILKPVAASGYSIGTLQNDLGQSGGVVATQLIDAYQGWAMSEHKDWVLDESARARTIADLSRNGHQISDRDHGRDLDAAVKSHVNAFLRSDEGVSFVHDRDTSQVTKLMSRVVVPLRESQLYQHASSDDQALLIAVCAKVFNQSEVFGQRIANGINDGVYRTVTDVNEAIDLLPRYVRSGRDHALSGIDLFNTMQQATPNNVMHAPWQEILANPLVNPSRLSADAVHPDLAQTYPTVKDMFVDPVHGRHMINALEIGGSYARTANGRGFYAEGRNFVEWGKAGNGRAFIDGQWSELSGDDVTRVANPDHTLDLNIRRHGMDEQLLHVTHPGAVSSHKSDSSRSDRVQHPGTLREHDRGVEVHDLQTKLAQLGFHDAHGNPLKADNDFGPDTKAAVKEFQQSQHLYVDGIAGSETFKALECATQPPVSSTFADTTHPGNGIYLQALDAVHRLDTQHCRAPDQRSNNLAAALTVAAQAHGIFRIDHVVLSNDASQAFAVQGGLNDLLKRYVSVNVHQAMKTPLTESSDQWQHNAQGLTPTRPPESDSVPMVHGAPDAGLLSR